jgi:hypothetical protein
MLNWGMAALYVAALGLVWWMAGDHMPFDMFSIVAMILLTLSLPSAYLGYAIELGRGRILQTIVAALALLNFPLGTAYGVFAIWVCWSAEKEVFDRGGVDKAPPERRRRVAEEVENIEDVATKPASTPYAIAKQRQKRGTPVGDIQQRLHEEGLAADEIETLMNSLGLRFSRAKQGWLERLND